MDPKDAGGLDKARAEWEGQNEYMFPLFLPTHSLLPALHKTSCFLPSSTEADDAVEEVPGITSNTAG